MTVPAIKNISLTEFQNAEGIYKIVTDEHSRTHVSFELNNRTYYIGYASSDLIEVEFLLLEKEKYLLIGVDLKAVVLSVQTGGILFAIGLFSYFKGFQDTSELTFTIFTELEDIVVNKNGLSISETTPHELQF